jgi:chaperonin GroES
MAKPRRDVAKPTDLPKCKRNRTELTKETKMVSIKVRFIPLGDRVVIMPLEGEQTTKGGIYLPDTAKEKPQEGEVIAVGPGRISDDGTRIPMELAVGDRVIYSKYAGTEYKDGDEEYLILRESDILAKIS